MHLEHGTLVPPLNWTLHWTRITSFNQKHSTELSFKQTLLPTKPIWKWKIHIATMRYQLGTKESNPEIRISSRKPFHFPSGNLRINVTKAKGENTWMPKSKNFIYSIWTGKNHTCQHKSELDLRKTSVKTHSSNKNQENVSLLEEASISQFLF